MIQINTLEIQRHDLKIISGNYYSTTTYAVNLCGYLSETNNAGLNYTMALRNTIGQEHDYPYYTYNILEDIGNRVDKLEISPQGTNKDLFVYFYSQQDYYHFIKNFASNESIIECVNEPIFILQIHCEAIITDPYVQQETVINHCTRQMIISLGLGCATDRFGEFWWWFDNNAVALMLLIGMIGIFFCFFGYKYINISLFIGGLFIPVWIIWIFLYSVLINDNSKTWVGWVILFTSLLFGMIIGFVVVRLKKLGSFIIVFYSGFMMGVLFYLCGIYLVGSNLAFWIICGGLGLLKSVISIPQRQRLLIHSVCMIGSFLIPVGIGQVIPGYPNPFNLDIQRQYAYIDKIDPVFYFYFGATIILYACGMLVQYPIYAMNMTKKKN
ncbi:UNKNOWN [Stylonychia lemnae]|uniref:Transmembrane protein 198 n=1 Tax=Stylonychia lemnae TaxID=5949 RepID=A0A078AVW9_STYLE|nr:UNKNOWN [Stylonychia lemnae]|eukprot:CDW86324.1 UNKNOWN [Stylonychia lemnae]